MHDALDVGFRQEAQEIDAARRDIGVGRKRDDRDVARPRHLPDDADRLREQRPEDDLGAFVERLLGALPRRLGGAAVVLHQELDVGGIELGERHLGGVAHRLPGDAGIAAGRQRQDQADLDLAGADGGAGRRLRALRRRRWRREKSSRLELPEQPAKSALAVVSKPCRARRRDDRTTDAWRGICATRRFSSTPKAPPKRIERALICHSGGE